MTVIDSTIIRIMGVDPGLRITGYGVIDVSAAGLHLVEGGVVRSKEADPLPYRLEMLHSGIREVLAELEPDVVAVEELYSNYAHPRTAIFMGHARGVVLLAAAQLAIPVLNYPSTSVKRSVTGAGHAGKSAMQDAVRRRLGLADAPNPPDVADALAIAICHAQRTLAGSSASSAAVAS